ncbi:MAG: hypothetical protein R2717_01005 [Schumannella sp.]
MPRPAVRPSSGLHAELRPDRLSSACSSSSWLCTPQSHVNPDDLTDLFLEASGAWVT